MSNMRRLIESMDSISKAEKKSTGPKFPGYWKGGDSADKSRSRMVGDESVIPQLAKQAKEKTLEWQIEEAYQQFKEQEAVVEVDGPAPYRGSAGSQEIQKLNPSIKDVNKIRPGQTFKMPDGSNYTVKPGDTLDKIARSSGKKPYKQFTTQVDPTAGEARDKAAQAAADVDARTPSFVPPPAVRRGNSASIRPPEAQYTYTAPPGVSLGTIPAGASLDVSPVKPAATSPRVATTGPLKGVNTAPLTRQQYDTINANDRAAAAAARAARENTTSTYELGRSATGPGGSAPTITVRPGPAREIQENEAVNKLAEQFAAFMEAQDEYGPEYQAMVRRVGDRARQGLMKTVWDPVKRVYKNVPVKQEKQVKEYENAQSQDSQITSPPAPDATAASQRFTAYKQLQNMNTQKTLEADAGAQDPNKQTTSPPSPAAVAKPVATAAPDVSVATARTTMAGLKPALGPGVDTNAAATGVTKVNLGQQLNPAEQQAVSAITPLVMKAATIPSAAPQLRSALTNAGAMAKASAAKQGKM